MRRGAALQAEWGFWMTLVAKVKSGSQTQRVTFCELSSAGCVENEKFTARWLCHELLPLQTAAALSRPSELLQAVQDGLHWKEFGPRRAESKIWWMPGEVSWWMSSSLVNTVRGLIFLLAHRESCLVITWTNGAVFCLLRCVATWKYKGLYFIRIPHTHNRCVDKSRKDSFPFYSRTCIPGWDFSKGFQAFRELSWLGGFVKLFQVTCAKPQLSVSNDVPCFFPDWWWEQQRENNGKPTGYTETYWNRPELI